MAKDAKGHGSEKRGGSALARMMTDAQAANALGQGHPKSAPVPTSSSMVPDGGFQPKGTYSTNQPNPAYQASPGSLKATWNFWIHNRMSDGRRWDRNTNTGVPGSRRSKWAGIKVKDSS